VSDAYKTLPLHRDPRFGALMNAIYHTQRANFLDKLNKAINSLVILLGAGVVGKVAAKLSFDETYLELALLVTATIQLVFDFGGSAKEHRFQQTRYAEALTDMEEVSSWNDAIQRKWSGRLVTIAATEGEAMRALDAVAFNQALDAMHGGTPTQESYRLRISWFHYAFRNIFAFSRTRFMPEVRSQPSFLSALFRGRASPRQTPGA
jgi:hypothetical protein